MAYAMTKQGSLDNCVTYEFICDTIEDMNAIEKKYRTIGSVAVVLAGASGDLEVYIAGSNKQWNELSGAGSSDSMTGGGLTIHICTQDEVTNGVPSVSEPDENTVYLVSNNGDTGNLYDEFIYVNNAWEKWGSADIDLSGFAPIANPEFTGNISLGRKANTTVGANSVAIGNDVTASDTNAHAEGLSTVASAPQSHAEGSSTIAGASNSHVEGQNSHSNDNKYQYTYCVTFDRTTSDNGRTIQSNNSLSVPGAYGTASHAEGMNTIVFSNGGHAEGNYSYAGGGPGTHAEGQFTFANGAGGEHAEGQYTYASGGGGEHAEGQYTYASGGGANHVEGKYTYSIGAFGCHSEGIGTYTGGPGGSHAEGYYTNAEGQGAHSEGACSGSFTYNSATAYYGAWGGADHSEGAYTFAKSGQAATWGGAHAEGYLTKATNTAAHAEGYGTIATGQEAHAEGYYAEASGVSSHAEGYYSKADGSYSHAEGYCNDTLTYNNTDYPTGAYGYASHVEGYNCVANNQGSHAEGYRNLALGNNSHVEGSQNIVTGESSHVEGYQSKATGYYAHAEGSYTNAGGYTSHAEGYYCSAAGYSAHAEGYHTDAPGQYSHAEGNYTVASGGHSHAEGNYTIAAGANSHVSGMYNVQDDLPEWASNTLYHVGDKVKRIDGTYTYYYKCKTEHTSGSTFVQTNNWISMDTIQYAEIVGNGTGSSAQYRSNARALTWEGDEKLAGDIYVGCASDSTGGTKLARIPDPPTTDGTYTLQATVSSGVITYSWVAAPASANGVSF